MFQSSTEMSAFKHLCPISDNRVQIYTIVSDFRQLYPILDDRVLF